MKKAIFLDRDGTLNNNGDHYYIWRKEDFHLNQGVTEVLSELRNRGYLLIVITNQGGVSKGKYTHEDVEAVHAYMHSLLEERGVELDEVLFCPHHPDREECLCRKPKPLMIQKALARFDIDPAESWMIGDSKRDMEAGKAARLRTLLVESNGNLKKVLDKID
ncbi:MAG: HAD family hydrolase [Bacteroidia bacterium]|nr:MAG: HAD family hydrolase [Bacteroidia bacterium]